MIGSINFLLDTIFTRFLLFFALKLYIKTLTYACLCCMDALSLSSRDVLNSWQYKAAKVVLRTKLNIPRSALLLELGWEPITTFIDRQRILYFKRLSDLPDSRLCKQVYNEMVRSDETFWNYKGHVDRTIHELDSNNLLYENIHVGAVNNAFGLYARGNLLLDVFSKSIKIKTFRADKDAPSQKVSKADEYG